MEETITIKKETKFLESINKYVCTMFVNREKNSLYSSWNFHENKIKAEENAMNDIKKQLAFWKEIEKECEPEYITITL